MDQNRQFQTARLRSRLSVSALPQAPIPRSDRKGAVARPAPPSFSLFHARPGTCALSTAWAHNSTRAAGGGDSYERTVPRTD